MKAFFKSLLIQIIALLVVTVFSFVFLPIFFIGLSKGLQKSALSIPTNSVLHLKIKGNIVEHAHPFDIETLLQAPFKDDERPQGLYEIVSSISRAKTDKRIKGIYLELRNFSAGWASINAIHRALLDFKKSGKFIASYANAYSEKSYYLATAAEKVFLAPSGDVEFNGLSVTEAFLKGLLEKLEVQPRIFRVGKFKAAIEPLVNDKMSAENREQNRKLIDDIWIIARGEFARFSKKSPEQIDELANGLDINSSEAALQAGLVTELKYEDEVLDTVRELAGGEDDDFNLVGAVRYLRDQESKEGGKSKNKIAIIFADGEISSGNSNHEVVGSETIVQTLQDLREDDSIKAVVLRVNSPGGDALAADVMWREVALTDQSLPVVVSMGDLAASGGYYIAAGARYIFAEPNTITGSIGVFGIMADTQKFFKNKLGVSFDRVVSHSSADIGNSNREMLESEERFIQSSVNQVYDRFLAVVQQGRKFPKPEDVNKIAEGRIWSGRTAKEIGLVDELGGIEQAIQKAATFAELSKDYVPIIYPENDEPFGQFMAGLLGEGADASLKGIFFRFFAGEILPEKSQGLLKQVRPFISTMPRGSTVYARLPSYLFIE